MFSGHPVIVVHTCPNEFPTGAQGTTETPSNSRVARKNEGKDSPRLEHTHPFTEHAMWLRKMLKNMRGDDPIELCALE